MSNSNKKVHKKINKNTNSKEKDEVKKKSWLDQQPLDMSTVVKEDFNEYNWTFDDDLPNKKKDVTTKTNKKKNEDLKTNKKDNNSKNKDNNTKKKQENDNKKINNDEINNKIDDEPKKKKLKSEPIKEINNTDNNKSNDNNQNKGDMTPITSMKLSKSTEDALKARGIEYLFPIQSLTYWPIREGRDLIGRARTGQGKTLAFCLPILEQLIEKNAVKGSKSSSSSSRKDINPKVLIMSPTRELAKQIVTEFQSVAGDSLRIEAIYGGTSLNENYNVLKKGVDVIVGTPGRIKDILEKKWLNLQDCAHVVLDEADQMLDMGFQEEITTIFEAFKNEDSTKAKLQVLLFSATMPQWVHSIVNRYMSKDHKIVDLVGDQKMKAVTTVRHIAIPSHWQMLGSTVNDIIAMFAGREGRYHYYHI